MIHVDETDPVGENESPFTTRTVKIARGVNPEEKYELIRELGRGKFGTVYRCREKTTNLQLAAKFVGIPNRGDRRNVEREVDIMNTLQHHLITQLYDAFEYKKMMCVVLEIIEGGELFDRVIGDDFVLTERACIVFVRQICEALEFIHRNHILHLDLKPENIMCLSREGNRIKIIDFGLARKFDPEKKMQILFGTPEFVAPEVVNFDPIDFGTDMWSVGVICYVLLSGLSPFMGETDIETMGNVTVAKYDFDDEAFNEISEDALNFITHLLVKETDKRMTATESLQHQWLRRQQQGEMRPPNKRAQLSTRTSQMEIPKVQLSPDLSPVVHCDEEVSEKADDHEFITDNDLDDYSSTLSSDSDFGLPPPPPLPKTAPPPLELLIESSLPIIFSTPPTAHHKSEKPLPPPPPLPTVPPPPAIKSTTMLIGEPDDQLLAWDETQRLATDRPNNGIDKELDMTKDNLKTFVERWDGSQPVEIPKPTGELEPPSTTLKSASMSSLAKLKPPKETTTKPTKKSSSSSSSNSSTDSKRNNNEVAKPSGFISPARIDNDSSSAPTGVAAIPKQEQPTVNGRDNGTVKAAATQEDPKKNKTITKGDSVAQVDESGTPRNNITKNLLDQLDQIKIKPTDGKLGQTEKTTVNGVNYLRVDNLAATSTSPSSSSNSALSSRGCSPSPCESLTSSADTQDQQTEDTFDEKSVKAPAGLLRDYLQTFDRRKSDSNYVLGNKKNNPANKEEKIDLVDEIKRLSDHLMMLNTLTTELQGQGTKAEVGEDRNNGNPEIQVPKKSSSKRSPSPNPPPASDTLEKRNSRTKLIDPANLSSKLESKIVKSQIQKFSNTKDQESASQSVTSSSSSAAQMSVNSTSSGISSCSISSMSSVRTATRLIEQLHKPQTPISQPPWMLKCKRTKFRMTELSRDVPQNAPDSHKTIFIEEAATNTKDCLLQLLDKYNDNTADEFEKRSLDIDRSVIPSSSSSSSSSIASMPMTTTTPTAKLGMSSKVSKTENTQSMTENGVTRTMTTKTKTTKTTSSSSSSKTKSTRTTNKSTTEEGETNGGAELEGKSGPDHPAFAKSIPRHFSLTLNWDKDNFEETTMNSLNTFFQRHSSQVGSSIVKQMQQQIEANRVPQK